MKNINVYKTNKNRSESIDIEKIKQSKGIDYTIEINTNKEFQEIIGFGGAFNEVGFEAIKSLNNEDKNSVMKELFTAEGCNFNLCRTPIGASDFALDAYSLNDTANDFEMENFSIDRDKKSLIPYIKEAFKFNSDLKVWSCPWSPAYWMKTNKDMCNGGELIDTPEILRAYATYFVKYLQGYEAEGIDIYGFCVQNETDVINVYPTSTMASEVMRKFIRAYLIPAMMKSKNKSEIWAGTIRDVKGYVDEIAMDPVIKQFVKGIGYQYSSAETVKDSYEKHQSFKLLHTESPCHNGANSWEEAKEIFLDIVSYLENGCTNYCYWNMVLNESGLSTWNWMQNSMVSINRETKEIIYNPEFYIMKHFSKFISRGAKRIETSGYYKGNYIAFKNMDGSYVFIVSNFEEVEKCIELKIDNEVLELVLEADSINTFSVKL